MIITIEVDTIKDSLSEIRTVLRSIAGLFTPVEPQSIKKVDVARGYAVAINVLPPLSSTNDHEFATRVRAALRRTREVYGARTVREVGSLPDEKLEALKGCGPLTVKAIRVAIKRYIGGQA